MKITSHKRPKEEKPLVKNLNYGTVFIRDSIPYILCDYRKNPMDSCRICNLINGNILYIDGDEKVDKLECELKIYGVNNG